MIHQRKILKAIAYAILLCFTSLTGAQPLYAIPANTQLPTGPGANGYGNVTHGVADISVTGNTMNIEQSTNTSVIQWDNFSIGADAAVNFVGKGQDNFNGFNSLNYVMNGPVSEIYGQLTALGGNIFIANPAGVQIGNSAQINVGSLYVTNKDVGEAVKHLGKNSKTDEIVSAIREYGVAETNAELMSLGAIVNAKKVTFDGGRIVLDTDRIYADNAEGELQPVDDVALTGMLNIITTDKDNVVLGYTKDDTAAGFDGFDIKVVNDAGTITEDTLEHGYMWVHDIDELQAMGNAENLNGWYALRNSIDAYATAEEGFTPIGGFSEDRRAFIGRFDGLGYSIFGLTINSPNENYVGLFGNVNGAYIRNFTLNSGSITGDQYVGSAIGSANDSIIENITNTASVSGIREVGGVVGQALVGTTMSGLINTGTITGTISETGDESQSVGGIVGYMYNSTLNGETYNLGSVKGGYNVGGIVGNSDNATIGDDAFQIYNQLNVEGEYNVGGIAGTLSDGTITNAANYGDVLAKGYTTETYFYHSVQQSGSTETIVKERQDVNVANAGGIAGASESGSKIENVVNSGNVTSEKADGKDYYKAGNIGGIVGRADNTTITNAENKENLVAGAHNVGGVAGFLSGASSIDGGLNNGGDITGTGARTDNEYTDEYYKFVADNRQWEKQTEEYTDGFVRERVRPYGRWDENEIFIVGNIGGIAGYVYGDYAQIKNSGNRGTVHSELIAANTPADAVPDTAKAANVGGVVGKISQKELDTMNSIKEKPENATVYQSYNTGNVQGYTGVGGVVGAMYNGSIANSYNLGTLKSTRQASDGSLEPLNMGGVVGDTTEDAGANAVIYDVYNAGTIGDSGFEYYGRHVGGVVGRLSGEIEKAYNTGDVYNGYSTVGGVVGWWYSGDITNVFNTGNVTVRVDSTENNARTNGSQVGGIAGAAAAEGGGKKLKNAYNLGTIRSFAVTNGGYTPTINSMGGIIGNVNDTTSIENVYTTNNLYAATANGNTENATYEQSRVYGVVAGKGTPKSLTNAFYVKQYDDTTFIAPDNISDNVTPIINEVSDQESSYNGLSFGDGNDWRIYDGTTPILNAFLPYMKESEDSWNSGDKLSSSQIQYGTAANPLLTILKDVDGDLSYNWTDLGLTSAGGLAVYGKDGGNISLTLNGFTSGGSGRYFGGTIYSDGTLTLNGETGGDFNLGSASKLYGSSVTLDTEGDVYVYGTVTSTNGDITINGDNVEIIGSLSAVGEGDTTTVDGISGATLKNNVSPQNVGDVDSEVFTIYQMYGYTTEKAIQDGNIKINAKNRAEILYGNLGTGSVSTAGEFKVTGGVAGEDDTLSGGSVYVDSDLSGTTGNINLSAGGEVLLDITNIAKANESAEDKNGAGALHKFLNNHSNGNSKITLDSANDDEIIAIDMWDDGTDTGSFALDKYNLANDKTLKDAFGKLNLGNGLSAEDIVHIWISDANQLKGIQSYYDRVTATGETTKILNYNFALKGNINASALEDYKAIGGESGYSGTFDGRDFRIIGLNAAEENKESASSGIFSRLTGTVKDLRVYASNFFGGGESAGAIAAVNEGTITGVTTFGNSVEAKHAGGIAGVNNGSILESTASDSVTASGENAYAGGVAGVNTGSIGAEGEAGESAQITADSAVRSGANGAAAIGGVVGKNETDGEVWLANSLGVTTGANAGSTGGIAGINSGTMTSLYNESIVTGNSNVGGVAGDNSGTMENAVNATRVTGTGTNTGGLVGNNSGTVDSGRNAGVITGKTSVGGMVGSNENSGILQNLSNAIVAAITGTEYVGGIAGSNAGSITSSNNLTNEGTVSGHTYVGGIAGVNTKDGTIENVLSETLVLKTGNEEGAQYFGGIAGQNSGAITNATNNSNVRADGATFVGGIVGENTGKLEGKLINEGDVTGKDKVGGLAGSNSNEQLLIGTKADRITVMNKGTVTATNGSAGGIFYENNGEIKYADLENSGTVIGTSQANTGGLFGVNTGDISHSTLTNSGTVTGGDNTGGLIGSNSGNVSNSSLINTVDAKVTGGDNTGGLIGKNTGTIKGGRGEGKDGMTMYTDKIYNNGTVIGGNNTGGLIGTNDTNGMLYAAYNTGTVTGAVYKDDGTVDHYTNNIGGIVGKNAGTVSSVFNTIMTADGQNQFVTGASNAGGIIGYNTGALKDAYNTTGVKLTGGASANAAAGSGVGENRGTIENVYATNTDGKLIGSNSGIAANVYTFAAGDGSAEYISGGSQKQSGSYGGFGFGTVWKNYDGWSVPMLKVFLTQAGYSADTELVQTGYPMSLPIKGYVVAGDNLIAYDNANALLVALANTELGEDYLAFYSTQIAASGEGALFNPNNLGYDIDVRYSIVPLFEHNTGYLHWLHRGGDRERNFRERKAEIYFHEGGMVHEETL